MCSQQVGGKAGGFFGSDAEISENWENVSLVVLQHPAAGGQPEASEGGVGGEDRPQTRESRI